MRGLWNNLEWGPKLRYVRPTIDKSVLGSNTTLLILKSSKTPEMTLKQLKDKINVKITRKVHNINLKQQDFTLQHGRKRALKRAHQTYKYGRRKHTCSVW